MRGALGEQGPQGGPSSSDAVPGTQGPGKGSSGSAERGGHGLKGGDDWQMCPSRPPQDTGWRTWHQLGDRFPGVCSGFGPTGVSVLNKHSHFLSICPWPGVRLAFITLVPNLTVPCKLHRRAKEESEEPDAPRGYASTLWWRAEPGELRSARPQGCLSHWVVFLPNEVSNSSYAHTGKDPKCAQMSQNWQGWYLHWRAEAGSKQTSLSWEKSQKSELQCKTLC